MKRVFSHSSIDIVRVCASKLNSEGIPTLLKNENGNTVMAGLPQLTGFPELWIANDEDYDRAIEIVKKHFSAEGSEWTCPNCGEKNPASFDLCWNCQTPHP